MPSAQVNLRVAEFLKKKSLLSEASDLRFSLGPNGIGSRGDPARMNAQKGETSAADAIGRQNPEGHCRKAGTN